ncbi:MAG: ABC transporter ATP-binding protein [Geminicoccaceae bacterium]
MSDQPPMVSVRNVSKLFGSTRAVDDVSVDIRNGEFFALLGPSGCGKSTLMRMIAGFEQETDGTILIDGADMTGVAPNRRPVNMVFQSYAVFPHMSVEDNVAYGLRVTGTPAREIGPRVQEALAQVQLQAYAKRRPDQLSGGQRQRVALARALIKRPKVLLLDEPLSALDAKLREDMQFELVRLQTEVGITFILVTHDQDEALSMADRIAVMRDGHIEQIAGPEAVYEQPANAFVADFLGTINLLDIEVSSSDASGTTIHGTDLGTVTLPLTSAPEGRLQLGIRPEKIRPGAGDDSADITIRGIFEQMAYFGDFSRLHLRMPSGQPLQVYVYYRSTRLPQDPVAGEPFTVHFDPADASLLPVN